VASLDCGSTSAARGAYLLDVDMDAISGSVLRSISSIGLRDWRSLVDLRVVRGLGSWMLREAAKWAYLASIRSASRRAA
jgi:hypothetical protein